MIILSDFYCLSINLYMYMYPLPHLKFNSFLISYGNRARETDYRRDETKQSVMLENQFSTFR
uniref:Uncharacterized protein n=1 Tax=Ascaris lumbricoides TaxID=6252 RepID=A0A0M3IKW4_ASCLU